MNANHPSTYTPGTVTPARMVPPGVLTQPRTIPQAAPGTPLHAIGMANLPRPPFSAQKLKIRITSGDPKLPNLQEFLSLDGSSTERDSGGFLVSEMACPLESYIPVSPRHMQMTSAAFPNSAALFRKFGLPIGISVNPMATSTDPLDEVPLVSFGRSQIIRCQRCRGYINFMCKFTDGGRAWRCALCQFLNNVPEDYFYPLDQYGRRGDAHSRPELCRGSVEFIAPQEYMIRAPMPPVYLFVLEATTRSMQSGAFNAMLQGIKQSLGQLVESDRTKVGLLTYNEAVHFYHIASDSSPTDHKISVLCDLDDVFLPSPDDTLVNLSEFRAGFEELLEKIPDLCDAANSNGDRLAFGAAMRAAYLLIGSYGGKVITLCCSRPSVGPGALKDRSDPSVIGTDRERQAIAPDGTYYKDLALEFSRKQMSVDLFLCPPPTSPPLDIASLATLPKLTCGDIVFMRDFVGPRDSKFLTEAVENDLIRDTAFEAVMRVRASKGIRCSSFLGRFYIRSTDLLALPNFDSDKCFGVQFGFDETVFTQKIFVVQSALLYTSSEGERRIRVNTLAVPVVNSLLELASNVDPWSTLSLMLRTATDHLRDRKIEDIRKQLKSNVVSCLSSIRQSSQAQNSFPQPGTMLLPESMFLVPLLFQGLLKSPLLSKEASIAQGLRIDDKAALIHLLDAAPSEVMCAYLYPNFIPLFPLDGYPEAGLLNEGMRLHDIQLPPGLPSATSSMKQELVFLIDTGLTMTLWLGRSAAEAFCVELGLDLSQQVDLDVLPSILLHPLQTGEDRTRNGARARVITQFVASQRPTGTRITVALQGGPLRQKVESMLIEDKTASNLAYKDFWSELLREIQSKSSDH